MLNITAAWRAGHAHLKPYRNHLPLPQDQLHLCPECGGTEAHHVVVNLLPANGVWVNNAQVMYCPDCDNFLVEKATLLGTHLDSPVAETPYVSEVDARLWSPLPTFLNIEPTTRCNFRCWYCIGRHMEQRDIRKEDFAAVLANTPAIRTIALVGEGEPLVHPDFFEMAGMAVDQGKKVVIISNGSLLNDANVKKLCESGVAYVAISIDSTEPARFARSRIKGNLAEVLGNIERLRAFRDANGYRYPKIAIKGTLFDYSENELLDIVTLAREHGAELFESFQPLNAKQSYVDIYPEENRGQLVHLDRIRRAITRDSSLARQLLRPTEEFLAEEGIEFGGPGRANGLRPNCDEQYVYALLTGDITPCCQVKQPIDPDWNLFHHPLKAIFQNPQYENMRFNLWNGIFPEYCRGCGKTPSVPVEIPMSEERTSSGLRREADWATKEDEADLLALFARAFGHGMPPEQWRWKYAAAETCGALVRKNTGQLVAFFGGMPRPIRFFGEAVTAVQIGDVMTDSVQGRFLNRQGPFFLAASAYLERFIGPDKAYRLGFGFPSKRHNRLAEHLGLYAAVGDVLEANWEPLPYRPRLAVSVRSFLVSQVDSLEPLWEKMAQELVDYIVPVKNGPYMRHRFFDHPSTVYLPFLVKWRVSGKPFGLLVLRDHGESGVELLDLVGPRNRLPALVRIARRITGKLGRQKLFAWLTKPVADNLAASHPRLAPTDISIPTSIWHIPSEVHRIEDRWWLMGGDADFR